MWVVRWQTLVVLALLPDVTRQRHATAKIFIFLKIYQILKTRQIAIGTFLQNILVIFIFYDRQYLLVDGK